jgi:hypothetical protein
VDLWIKPSILCLLYLIVERSDTGDRHVNRRGARFRKCCTTQVRLAVSFVGM